MRRLYSDLASSVVIVQSERSSRLGCPGFDPVGWDPKLAQLQASGVKASALGLDFSPLAKVEKLDRSLIFQAFGLSSGPGRL
jgi:hypothetical protein